MTDTNTLVFELPEKELSTALSAFKLAHKEEADLRFAPDRAWIEGYAAASKTKHTEAPKSPDAEETRRTDVARAIWEVMREHEDSCDLSLDDIPTSHQVWFCADAAISAQAAHVDAATWQPIASAPKDGKAILLRSKNGRIADGLWSAANSHAGFWAWAYVHQEPVEWMPKPGSPAARAQEQQP